MLVASPSPEASRGGGVFALHPDVAESLDYISAKGGKEDICNFWQHVRVTMKKHRAFILLNVSIQVSRRMVDFLSRGDGRTMEEPS
jgi:hypothetical protein